MQDFLVLIGYAFCIVAKKISLGNIGQNITDDGVVLLVAFFFFAAYDPFIIRNHFVSADL